ncbi:MAG: hypothetical protein C4293_03035 [Nitrospiraceae bacterium]
MRRLSLGLALFEDGSAASMRPARSSLPDLAARPGEREEEGKLRPMSQAERVLPGGKQMWVRKAHDLHDLRKIFTHFLPIFMKGAYKTP